MLRSLTSRQWLALAAAAIWATLMLSYVIATEEPTGKVQGTVVASDTGRPIPNASVVLKRDVPVESEDWSVRSIQTDKKGRFRFEEVPVGKFKVEASGSIHHLPATRIIVQEGKILPLDLELAAGKPYFNLSERHPNFTTDEAPEIVIDGFTPGSDILVTLRKVNADKLLSGGSKVIESVMRNDRNAMTSVEGMGALSTLPETVNARIDQRDAEGVYHQKIKLPLLPAGIYAMKVATQGFETWGWMFISDLFAVSKQCDNDILVYTTNAKTGRSVGPSAIRVFQDGQPVGSGVTDGEGVWRSRVPQKNGAERRLMVARNGESIAFISSYLHGYSDYEGEGESQRLGPNTVAIYAYTERPVYRPGHVVRFRGIVRKFTVDNYQTPRTGQVRVEVRDPRDSLVYARSLPLSRFGSFHDQFKMVSYSPTGEYQVKCIYAGKEKTVSYAVAEYRKPEFEVSVELPKRCVRGDRIKAKIRASYYFGAPVVGAEIKYSVWMSEYWFSESEDENYGYSEYVDYGDYGKEVTHGTIVTGPDGTAEVEVRAQWNLPKDDYSGSDRQFTVSATVTDQSRREAEGTGSVVATMGAFHLDATPIDYVTEAGKSARFTLTTIGYDRKPQRGVEVDVSASRVTYENDEENYEPVASGKVTTDQWGRGTFAFTPKIPGQFVIRAVCRDAGGQLIKSQTWAWVPGAGEFAGYRYPQLQVVLDKKSYNPGDKAKILINSSETGETALITVEGRRLYDHKLVKLSAKTTVAELTIRPEYCPNFYVSVCYVRDGKFANQEARAKVSLAEQTINLSVTPDKKKYEPGDIATYLVKAVDSRGKPVSAEVSLGVVDEAIYAIREDDTMPIRDFFYSHQYNSVSTDSSSPEIYYSGDKAGFTGKVRKEFVDTAFWRADLVTDSRGEARARFKLPDNLTTWRATARACTADTAVGETTSTAVCSKKLLVRLETPRFLVQKDETVISAIVHNYLPKTQNVRVVLRAPGLSIRGGTSHTVTIASNGVQRVEWNATAPRPGDVTLTAYASGQDASDAMQITIPIRPHGQRIVETRAGSIAGKSVTEGFLVRADSVPGATDIRIRLAPSLAASMLGSLQYLAQYPYGCTEQTTSSFLPDVVIWKSMKTFGIENTDLKKTLPDMVGRGLNKLYDFQHEEGGGWGWCEYDKDDLWMTSYVVFALLTARSAGFDVNSDSLQRGLGSIQQHLQVDQTKLQKAEGAKPYALYVLSLAHRTELVRQNFQSVVNESNPTPQNYALFAMTLANIGDAKGAKEYLSRLWETAISSHGEIHWGQETHHDYTAPTEVTAQAFMAIQKVTPADPRIPQIVRWLLGRRQLNHWYSTRDTAMILYGLSTYLEKSKELQPNYTARVTVDGRLLGSLNFDRLSLFQPEPELVIPAGFDKSRPRMAAGSHDVRISMQGQETLYYTIQQTQYVERREKPNTITGSGITVAREYHKLIARWDGSYKRNRLLPADESTTDFRSGDAIKVRLIVRSNRELYHVLVEDYLPAGCEAFDRGRMDPWEWENWWADQDVRDERVSFYVETLPRGKSVLEYEFRAGTPGTYHAMCGLVELMYDPSVSADGQEDTVTVR